MAVIQIAPETTRNPGPYSRERRCTGCGAFLSSFNPSPTCAPCSGGDWIPGEPTERQLKKLRAARLEEIGAVAA